MTRTALVALLLAAATLASCEVSIYGIDDTKPVIESVSISPSEPMVGDTVSIATSVYEPDSWYDLTFDTDGDGWFDDTDEVTLTQAGWHTIRVRARSAGGTDVVTYPFEVSTTANTLVSMLVYNNTDHGVALTITDSAGNRIVENTYVAPNSAYGYYVQPNRSYEIAADNQYAEYGPEWVYVGTDGGSFSLLSL